MEGFDDASMFKQFLAFQKHRNNFVFALVRARDIENRFIALQKKQLATEDLLFETQRELKGVRELYWKVAPLPIPNKQMQEALAKKLRKAIEMRSSK